MTTISVTDVKKNLIRLLAADNNGEEIVITEGDRPVGIIQPIKAFSPAKSKAEKEIEEQAFALSP